MRVTKWQVGWAAYWLLFAAMTLNAARSPGFVRNPELVPYPWRAAFTMCGLMGLQIFALAAALRPMRRSPSFGRWLAAVALVLAFLAARVLTFGTDQPGYVYIPDFFALANVVVVPGVASVSWWQFRRAQRSGSSGARPNEEL